MFHHLLTIQRHTAPVVRLRPKPSKGRFGGTPKTLCVCCSVWLEQQILAKVYDNATWTCNICMVVASMAEQTIHGAGDL